MELMARGIILHPPPMGMPAGCKMYALIVWTVIPAVDSGHAEAARPCHTHLYGLAEHNRAHGHLHMQCTRSAATRAWRTPRSCN